MSPRWVFVRSLALAAPALAAFAPPALAGTVAVSGTSATFAAGSGERNRVVATLDAGTVTVRDSGANVAPRSGCTAVDAVGRRGPRPRRLRRFDGGDGSDALVGGTGADAASGGRGNDVLRRGMSVSVHRARQHASTRMPPASAAQSPAGIPGSALAGPFPVGLYAARLRERLRQFTHVQLLGEACDLRQGRARVYFELRDAQGALPCSMWRKDFEALGLPDGALAGGAQVVVAGGCDFYPGSATGSPHFLFQVADLRIAGEGDLLAEIERLRRRLAAEGLLEPQKRLSLPALPRAIGVVTGEQGKARDDVLAGLARRGWAGRLVWAFSPVQDRHAAPAIGRALTDLAALDEIDVVVVARGGGSLADLLAFCDETLCRTVALLRVPVVASVGHHTDRTLIDDVAAVSCSTPTHAAEAAVPLHCAQARGALAGDGRRLAGHGRRAVVERARALAHLSRAPAEHVARHRRDLHQKLRELRASARRGLEHERRGTATRARVAERKALAAAGPERLKRARELEGLAAAIAAHDPGRTLARGYALVEDGAGGPVTSAAAARAQGAVRVRFADATVAATVHEETP